MTELVLVQGAGEDDRPPVTRRQRVFCEHGRFELDERSRRVYCADCEDEIDAFDALLRIAGMFERVNGQYKSTSRKVRQAEEQLAMLQRELRNTQARARRQRTCTPPAEGVTA